MSLKRYAAKRDNMEAEITSALLASGCTVQQISIKGVPDLLVGFNGMNFLLEVKSAKGTLTPDQVEFFEMWEGQVTLVRTIEEALEVIGR
jgi:Holliday junction resolvase